MCGNWGYITRKDANLTPEQKVLRGNIFTGLGMHMMVRGKDAAGIAGLVNGEVITVKRSGKLHPLALSKDYNDLLALQPDKMLGHTRLATVGANTDKNAHPFTKGDITGTHNGSVFGHASYDREIEVDSEIIFELLNENKNDYRKAFKDLNGTFAIAWWNMKHPEKLFLVTHNNPLVICRVRSLQTIFYCSTFEAMQLALASGVGVKDLEIWEPKADKVYEIDELLQVKKYNVSFKSWSSGSNTNYTGKGRDEFGWDNYNKKFTGHSVDTCAWPGACATHTTMQLSDGKAEDKKKDIRDSGEETLRRSAFKGGDLERAIQYSALTVPDLCTIYNAVEGDGCYNCDRPVGVDDEGIWWYKSMNAVVCPDCLELLPDATNLTWFAPEEYDQVILDVEELRKQGLIAVDFMNAEHIEGAYE